MPKGTSDRDPLDAVLRPPVDETDVERSIRLQTEERAKRVSEAIDETIRQERQAAKKKDVIRVLLLGQSESGAKLLSSLLATTFTYPRQGNPRPLNVGPHRLTNLPMNRQPFQSSNASILPRLSGKNAIYGVLSFN